ncbi:hypothetical protein BRD01_09320 [Halobacteriales archaeon QS_8_65_32]|nr:MAG: hypothetical protein BRD01_09320 [Halobacteriales archaeon QS_8_65_32]
MSEHYVVDRLDNSTIDPDPSACQERDHRTPSLSTATVGTNGRGTLDLGPSNRSDGSETARSFGENEPAFEPCE